MGDAGSRKVRGENIKRWRREAAMHFFLKIIWSRPCGWMTKEAEIGQQEASCERVHRNGERQK